MFMEFFTTCNGLPVHVSDSKKGDNVIILLHGYLETLYIWDEFETLLSTNMRVVSIDIPGHGLSASYPINTMENCASALICVMDKLNIDKAWLVGHSMGGYVAVEALKLFSNRFLGLIMINSIPYADTEEKRESRDREISLIKHKKLQTIVKCSVENMFANENVNKFEEKILEISEIAEVHDPQGIVASLEGMKQREDYTDYLSKCELPLLFIFGDKDNFISLQTARDIQTKIPKATYFFLESSGHNSFIEEPNKCAQKILQITKN